MTLADVAAHLQAKADGLPPPPGDAWDDERALRAWRAITDAADQLRSAHANLQAAGLDVEVS